MSIEAHIELKTLQEKVLQGIDVSPEEYSKIIDDLREDRSSGKASGGAAKPKITEADSEKALKELFD